MAPTISFHSDYIKLDAHNTIKSISFGFTGANDLPNGYKTPKPATGDSTQAVVTYTNGNQVTFSADAPADFGDGNTVTVTGGGGDDKALKADDGHGNQGSWSTTSSN